MTVRLVHSLCERQDRPEGQKGSRATTQTQTTWHPRFSRTDLSLTPTRWRPLALSTRLRRWQGCHLQRWPAARVLVRDHENWTTAKGGKVGATHRDLLGIRRRPSIPARAPRSPFSAQQQRL